MKKAELFKTNGDVVEIQPKNGGDFTLDELYEHIGCRSIDILRLDTKRLMVLDDEGKLAEKEVNSNATMIADVSGVIPLWDCIVGDVIICDNDMVR